MGNIVNSLGSRTNGWGQVQKGSLGFMISLFMIFQLLACIKILCSFLKIKNGAAITTSICVYVCIYMYNVYIIVFTSDYALTINHKK